MGIPRDHPELALFFCLAAGYLVGRLRVGPITLGGICGTLIGARGGLNRLVAKLGAVVKNDATDRDAPRARAGGLLDRRQPVAGG